MFTLHNGCRACKSDQLSRVFSLGVQPLANAFKKADDEHPGMAPLEVLFCKDCTLAQLSVTVNPGILYKHYAYVTSNSNTMRRHFERLCKDVISENGIGSLLEIGSNDGTFLRFARDKGFAPVCGIDPAENLLAIDLLKAKMQVSGLFDETTAAMAKDRLSGQVDTIMARHVFCHIDNWSKFMMDIDAISNPKTLVCIEVPYVKDLIERCEWTTIYHEHTSYLSLRAMLFLLGGTMWHIHGVKTYGIHGGAVLVMLRRNDSGIEPHLSADEMIASENITEEDWQDFRSRAESNITKVGNFVRLCATNGKRVCAFGASAKATVLINACGFDPETIRFVTDNSPHKPGTFIPGTRIPVIPEEELLSEHPDYALLGAWNYAAEIADKNRKWLDRGGAFILPNEKVELISGKLDKAAA